MIPLLPTSKALDWLKKREGKSDKVYFDTQGHLTGGYGHKLDFYEKDIYREGERLQEHETEAWLRTDSQKAWDAAIDQEEIIERPTWMEQIQCVEMLFHVSYQLGICWYAIHKKTWQMLKDGDFTEAAIEAEDSLWFDQTPKRVMDFQRALTNQPKKEEYS